METETIYPWTPLTPEQITKATITPAALGRFVGQSLMGRQYRIYPWLLYLEQRILEMLFRPGPEIMVVSVPPQQGKALAVETPVPTPVGWTTMGELREGDWVIGHDGRPTQVIEAFEPYQAELSRVTFEDGSEILADRRHFWSLVSRDVAAYRQKGEVWGDDWPSIAETISTDDAAARQHRPDRGARWRIPVGSWKAPAVDLPLDPYLLGYWLGDGATAEPQITVSFDDLDHLTLQARAAGYSYRVYDRGSAAVVRLLGQRKTFTDLGLLGHKHIPEQYLRAGTQQRLLLLAGLMDSDGGMSGTTAEIAQQSKVLATGVEELVASLGGVVRTSERPSRLNGRATGATTYRQKITAAFNPFRLPRKRAAWAAQAERARWSQRSQRTITSIERTGVISTVRCIRVNNEHGLFLAGRSMIPTHNSTYCSLFLPCWYLGHNPGSQVLNISYSEEQAAKWGERSRQLMKMWGGPLFGVRINSDIDAKTNWSLGGGFGGMLSTGIRGGITGNPGHLILLDDTLKGREDVNSPTIKKKNIEEWHDSITTRFQDDTKVLVVATRWCEDDLSGHILEEAAKPTYQGYPVHELNIKAIAEPNPDERKMLARLDAEAGREPDDPDSLLAQWRDVLGRKEGDTLRGQHSPKFFFLTKASRPAARWNALYQGTPGADEDGMFPESKWRFWTYDDYDGRPPEVAVLPELTKVVRVWDLAASEDDGDWTVGTKMGRSSDGRMFVLDVQRFRHAPGRVHELVMQTAQTDGYQVAIRIEQERSGAGITVVDDYKRELLGYDVDGIKAEGDKTSRAQPWSRIQNVNRAHLPAGADWVDRYTGNHAQMDGKGGLPRYDDEIDTSAYAAVFLLGTGDSMIYDPNSIGTNRQDLTDDEIMDAMLVRSMLGLD